MKRNEAKIDLRTSRNWYPGEGKGFVREGKAGQGRTALSESQMARFKEKFDATLRDQFQRYAENTGLEAQAARQSLNPG